MANHETEPASPELTVIIPSWNTLSLTRDCLSSLTSKDHNCSLEIIVIENGSTDGSLEMIKSEFPEVRLIVNANNEYYSHACNQGAHAAHGRFLCFLNSDTVVFPNSLRLMIDFLSANSDYGAVAPQLVNLDGSVQPICRRFPTLMEVITDQFSLEYCRKAKEYRARASMQDFDHSYCRDVDQPPGTCLIMHRSTYETTGGFDEDLPLFYSDVAICRGIWASGKKIRFLSTAKIAHVGSASVLKHPLWRGEFMRNQVTYFRKHHGWLTAQLARAIIVGSMLRTALATALGRQPLAEKKRITRTLFSSAYQAVVLSRLRRNSPFDLRTLEKS